MQTIELDALLSLARTLEGEVLYTVSRQHTPFTLEVMTTGIRFTPHLSSQPRNMSKANLEAALAAFGQKQSFIPSDYPESKAAGTYWLTIVKRYLESK